MNNYSAKELEDIFVKRTQEKYPKAWSDYAEFVSHEKMSRDEYETFNFSKRLEILNYAYQNTVFYRNLYDAHGINPKDIKTESDWEKLPIVTKQMVREHGAEMIVGGPDGMELKTYGRSFSTGGSTGRPLKVYNDSRYTLPGYEWRARGWWLGRPLGDVLGSTPVIGQHEAIVWRMSTPDSAASKARSRNHLFLPTQRFYLDAQAMSEDAVKAFTAEIGNTEITFMHGYAGAILELADYYANRGVPRTYHPATVATSATPLSAAQRKFIGDVFECPVYDYYSCNEVSWMAVETPGCKGNLLVLGDMRDLEIVDANGKKVPYGTEGIVCVTAFTNKVMPFIRYSLGDLATPIDTRDQLGTPFPVISPIKGRESDYLEDVNGDKVFGWNASFDLEEFADLVSAFQYRQIKPGEVLMRIVRNKELLDFNQRFEGWKKLWFDPYVGRLHFTVEEAPEIPHDGGKIRFIVHGN